MGKCFFVLDIKVSEQLLGVNTSGAQVVIK